MACFTKLIFLKQTNTLRGDNLMQKGRRKHCLSCSNPGQFLVPQVYMQRSWSLRTSGPGVSLSNDWKGNFFYTSFQFFSSCLRKGHDPDALHLLAQWQKSEQERGKKQNDKDVDTSSRVTHALSKFLSWCSTSLYEVLTHAGVGERLICTFWRVEREWREGDQ